ncbi:hypothetical protein EDB89DRAFT_119215 [Lactarius sanguifluus]|nr:hypothetical protein EDB89DRAFT_119215 [Lactarius sanguifluus]
MYCAVIGDLDTPYPQLSVTRHRVRLRFSALLLFGQPVVRPCGLVSLDPSPNLKTRLSRERVVSHPAAELCRGTSVPQNEIHNGLYPPPQSNRNFIPLSPHILTPTSCLVRNFSPTWLTLTSEPFAMPPHISTTSLARLYALGNQRSCLPSLTLCQSTAKLLIIVGTTPRGIFHCLRRSSSTLHRRPNQEAILMPPSNSTPRGTRIAMSNGLD